MNAVYIISILTGIIFVLFAEIDKKITKREDGNEDKRDSEKPFKTIIKHLLFASIACFSAFFVVNQCKKMFHIDKTPNVFVNDPEF